jgi:hypothetical protein
VKLFFQIRLPFGSAAAFFLGLYIETKLWAWGLGGWEPVSFHSIFEVYISMKSAAPSWQSDLEKKFTIRIFHTFGPVGINIIIKIFIPVLFIKKKSKKSKQSKKDVVTL